MMKNHLIRIYTNLLHLYPQPFRAEFGDEMRAAFEQSITEKHSLGGLVQICLKEMRDFPIVAIQEYWLHFRYRDKENIMGEDVGYIHINRETKPSLGNETQPETWKVGFLAGLPHLIIAALLLVVTLITFLSEGSHQQRRFEIISVVFAWTCVGILIMMLIIAWRKGWPRWSASYYFYAFLAIVGPTLLLIQNQVSVLPYFLYIVILALWIYKVTQQDAIKGLLMITPVAILSWFPVLEFLPNIIRGPLQIVMFLITALAAIMIARFGSWRIGIWTIIGSSMLVGIPISYFRTYHHNIPPEHAGSASIESLTGRYAGALLWSAMLVIAPLLLWALWELSNRCGKDGKSGYRLAFVGLLLNLVGNMLSDFWYLSLIIKYPYHEFEILFAIMIILGAIIFIFGTVKLLKIAKVKRILKRYKTIALFLFVAIGLPLMFMFPMFDRRRYVQTNLPFGLFYENNVPDVLTYGLGALWLFIGALLLTRLRVSEQPSSDYIVS